MSATTHLMTAEELMKLPDDGNHYELIKGELLTISPPGDEHGARDRVGTKVLGYRWGAPDLVVEVMSQWDSKPKATRKAELWVELGARSVWVVNPRKRTVEVFRPDVEKKLFHDTDELFDDTVPGFRVKVSEIFA